MNISSTSLKHKSRPFLKWAGGKRWFVSNYDHFLPVRYNTYIEPFLGSGAVFFGLTPQKAILADTNEDLINTYITIRDDWQNFLKTLQSSRSKHSKDYYYKVRGSKPRTPRTRAARFVYLNRTCFNAIYRVNKAGQFNVPKGTKNTIIYPYDDFEQVSKYLQNVHLLVQDFESTIKLSHKGDFLYIDPPYTVKHNTNNFIKYNETIFSWEDQIRLSKALTSASERGVKVLVSNADSPFIHELYQHPSWTIYSVERSSIIASSSKFRKPTTEVLITNYEPRKL